MFRSYYFLTKPGIVYGNALSAVAGFFLATKSTFNPLLFIATLLGISLVIASACVFNNYLDRDIDAKMERTKRRALVAKSIRVRNAMIFGIVLGILGVLVLFLFTNLLTLFVGVIGFIFYVLVYGYAKRKSVHGTLIGSISGSMPLVGGYTAVADHIDSGTIILFFIMAAWQMPHFYAIAIYRLHDYQKAHIPVLPAVKGIQQTRIQIILYIIIFFVMSLLLTFFHYTGYIYALIMFSVCSYWLWLAFHNHGTGDTTEWAKGVFRFSLIVLLTFCFLLIINVLLPK